MLPVLAWWAVPVHGVWTIRYLLQLRLLVLVVLVFEGHAPQRHLRLGQQSALGVVKLNAHVAKLRLAWGWVGSGAGTGVSRPWTRRLVGMRHRESAGRPAGV